MRKVFLLVILLLTLIGLSGCISYDEATIQLIAQYDDYVEHDIADMAHFQKYINDASYDVVPGVVLIKTKIMNQLNFIVDEIVGTGYIVDSSYNKIHVITPYDVIEVTNSRYHASYEIVDYKENTYQANLMYASSALNLATLEITAHLESNYLRVISHENVMSYQQEPILMIYQPLSYRNKVIMGLLSSVNESNELITTLPYNKEALGAIVLNTNKKMIGMVTGLDSNQLTIISIDVIEAYLKQIEN